MRARPTAWTRRSASTTNWTINTYYAQTPGRLPDERHRSYRAHVNYNGDRYGLQFERLVVGDNFNPRGRLPSARQFRPPVRPRSVSVRGPDAVAPRAQVLVLGAYDYIVNGIGRLETRDGERGTSASSSRTATGSTRRWAGSYEFLMRPFAIAPGVTIPIGGYGFGDVSAVDDARQPAPGGGHLSVSRGRFYDGERHRARFSSGRIEVSPRFSLEPSFRSTGSTCRTGSSPHAWRQPARPSR